MEEDHGKNNTPYGCASWCASVVLSYTVMSMSAEIPKHLTVAANANIGFMVIRLTLTVMEPSYMYR